VRIAARDRVPADILDPDVSGSVLVNRNPMPSTFRNLRAVAIIGLVVGHLAAVDVRAQGAPIASGEDPVLVENGTVTIRRSDYQRELERLPPEVRPGFLNSE